MRSSCAAIPTQRDRSVNRRRTLSVLLVAASAFWSGKVNLRSENEDIESRLFRLQMPRYLHKIFDEWEQFNRDTPYETGAEFKRYMKLLKEWSTQLKGQLTSYVPAVYDDSNKLSLFLRYLPRFFSDVLVLEQWIRTGVQRIVTDDKVTGREFEFIRMLLKHDAIHNPLRPIIVRDLDRNVHAEIRMLHHLRVQRHVRKGEQLPFIGISQRCCPFCWWVFQVAGAPLPGGHGRVYPN